MLFSEFSYLIPREGHSPSGERSRLSRLFKNGSIIRLQPAVYLPTDQWLGLSFKDRQLGTLGSLMLTSTNNVFVGLSALALLDIPIVDFTSSERIKNSITIGVTSQGGVRTRKPVHCYGNPQDAVARLQQLKGKQAGHRLPAPPRIRGQLLTATTNERLDLPGFHKNVLMEPLSYALPRAIHELSFEARVTVMDHLLRSKYVGGSVWSQSAFAEISSTLPSGIRRSRFREAALFASPFSESVGESLSRALIHRLGFEAPEIQVPIQLPNGQTARPDFYWRKARIVGEFDGAHKYTNARNVSGKHAGQVIYEEKLREDALRSLDNRVCRWGWNDLKNADQLANVLSRAGVPRPFPRGRVS